MSISSRKIRNRLKRFWPELQNIWLTDPVYLNTPKEIVDVLALWEGELRKYSFKKNLLECDAKSLHCFAMLLLSSIRFSTTATNTIGHTVSVLPRRLMGPKGCIHAIST
jgi:hypothetical protein